MFIGDGVYPAVMPRKSCDIITSDQIVFYMHISLTYKAIGLHLKRQVQTLILADIIKFLITKSIEILLSDSPNYESCDLNFSFFRN